MSFLSKLPSPALTGPAWIAAVILLALLGWLRIVTDAQFAFASAAMIPVFLVTWVGGFLPGVSIALLASAMWISADVLSDREFNESWIPLVNGLTRLATYSFVVYLTARIRSLLQEEIERAMRDPLTGLLNRRAFNAAGTAEINRAARYSRSMAIMFLDLDNFKQLNDMRGHKAGDGALKATGTALMEAVRSVDSVARLGGDEFAVLMIEIDADAVALAAQKIAARLTRALADFPPVSASIGVAWFSRPGAGFGSMLESADALMYEVKRKGKGQIQLRSFEYPESTIRAAGAN